MISSIQVAGVVFVAIMAYFTYEYYFRKDYTRTEYVFWNPLWIPLLMLVLYHFASQSMLQVLSLAMSTHLYAIAGIMLVFIVLFFQHDNIRKNQEMLDKLVQVTAIENAKKRK